MSIVAEKDVQREVDRAKAGAVWTDSLGTITPSIRYAIKKWQDYEFVHFWWH